MSNPEFNSVVDIDRTDFILLRQNTQAFKPGDEWRVEPYEALAK
jgi:hypothetical protein